MYYLGGKGSSWDLSGVSGTVISMLSWSYRRHDDDDLGVASPLVTWGQSD